MAIDSITEKPRGPESSLRTDDNFQNPRNESSREFTIVSTSIGDSAALIRYLALSQGLLPRIGNPHPDDYFLRCVGVSVRKIAPIYYEAEASYVSLSSSPDGENNDPTLEPNEYDWDFAETTEPIDEDVNGDPIQTITQEAFDPPITEQFYDLVLTVTSNVAQYDPLQAADYMGAVSSDSFAGFPPGTARIIAFRASAVITPDFSYWRRTIGIQFRMGTDTLPPARAWWRRIKAEGLYERIFALGEWVRFRCVDDAGEFASTPVRHNKDTGEILAEDDETQWYEFKTKKTRPFGVLNIG